MIDFFSSLSSGLVHSKGLLMGVHGNHRFKLNWLVSIVSEAHICSSTQSFGDYRRHVVFLYNNNYLEITYTRPSDPKLSRAFTMGTRQLLMYILKYVVNTVK